MKESSLPKTRCSMELRKKAEIRAKELVNTTNLSEYIRKLVEEDTKNIIIESKEEILIKIVMGEHPEPVNALVDLVNDNELKIEDIKYKLTIPPKLRSLVLEKLEV